MKSLEWYLENDKEKLRGATARVKDSGEKGEILEFVLVDTYKQHKNYKIRLDGGLIFNLYKPSQLELVNLNNNINNINEEVYKTMEVNVINHDVIKANTAIKVMWQGDDFAYNCIVQYSTEKYIHCYGLSAKTNKIEKYAISADDLESGKIMILEIMRGNNNE